MTRILSLISIAILVAAMGQFARADSGKLAGIHQWITEQHPDVNHIGSSELVDRLGSEDLVIFDVREPDEFAVSHLENAVRVDPDVSRSEFLNLFGENVAGKTVIFYCSVGRRSSLLVEKVGPDLERQGSGDVVNLEQGIFGWHNRQLPWCQGPTLPSMSIPTAGCGADTWNANS